MDVLTGLGLAAPAGLNAPLTLLLVALADRFTGLVDLPADYDALSSWWAIGGLAVWLVVEEVVDKIPGADHVNDAVMTVVRPAAGGLLALAVMGGELPEGLAATLGVALAGTAHATKAGARPAVTVGTAGMGNPVASVIEDVVAVGAVIVALVVPVLVVLVLGALVAAAVCVFVRWRRLGRRRAPT
jgi:hypothetical protein